MTEKSHLKLGTVPYLNALPLLEGLNATFPAESWARVTPRDLAGLLASGDVDIALVSTFEGLRSADRLSLIPGSGICSDGPVRSVQIFSKVPLAEIRTILLDRASLSSSNLARIIAREHLGIGATFTLSEDPLVPGFDRTTAPEDAFLVIGDTALEWEGTFPYALDLGAAWKELTNLPFVYAGWFVRREVALDNNELAAFAKAREQGVRNIHEIVARFCGAEVSPERRASLLDYLGRAIRYEVGDRELAGLGLYRDKLMAHGLLPVGTPELNLT